MEYTKEEMESIIKNLKEYGSIYEVLVDFFDNHLKKGSFDFGLKCPGTQSSANFIKEIGNTFPDIKEALFMPKDDLPLYITNTPDVIQEYPIVCWRLKNDK